jgi:hypothetical protein
MPGHRRSATTDRLDGFSYTLGPDSETFPYSSLALEFLFPLGLSVIHPQPQPGFPAPDGDQKKFNSRPVAPTSPPLMTGVVSGGSSLTIKAFFASLIKAISQFSHRSDQDSS